LSPGNLRSNCSKTSFTLLFNYEKKSFKISSTLLLSRSLVLIVFEIKTNKLPKSLKITVMCFTHINTSNPHNTKQTVNNFLSLAKNVSRSLLYIYYNDDSG